MTDSLDFPDLREQIETAHDAYMMAVIGGLSADQKGKLAAIAVDSISALVAAVRAEERNRVTVEQIERTMFYGIGDHSPAVQPCCRRAAAAAVHRLYSGEATDG